MCKLGGRELENVSAVLSKSMTEGTKEAKGANKVPSSLGLGGESDAGRGHATIHDGTEILPGEICIQS